MKLKPLVNDYQKFMSFVVVPVPNSFLLDTRERLVRYEQAALIIYRWVVNTSRPNFYLLKQVELKEC